MRQIHLLGARKLPVIDDQEILGGQTPIDIKEIEHGVLIIDRYWVNAELNRDVRMYGVSAPASHRHLHLVGVYHNVEKVVQLLHRGDVEHRLQGGLRATEIRGAEKVREDVETLVLPDGFFKPVVVRMHFFVGVGGVFREDL